MKGFARRVLYLTCLTTVFAGPSFAQAPATGTPPFSSIAGGPFDAVNLGNLNVHFSVPIVHKAGRGIPFNYDLNYESSIYEIVTSGSTKSWKPVNTVDNVASYWGWQGLGPVVTPYVSYSVSYTTNTCYNGGPVQYQTWVYSYFVYHDPMGGAHAFNVSDQYISSPGGTQCPPNGPEPPNGPPPTTSADSSGYTLYLAVPGESTTSGYIKYKDGSTINVPFLTSPPTGSSPYTATDANGNYTSFNNGVYTDTLGTTVLTASGTAPSPVTFTYTGPAGSQHFTVNFTPYNIKTNFGCSGVTGEYNASNVSLVNTIVLPDNSQYSFTYENTPNNTGYKTGRISQVTLPTGGTISYNYTYAGTNDGINCTDGTTLLLQRTLNPGGQWQYSRSGSGAAWTTLVQDAGSNQTSINFEEFGLNFYETQRLAYQGSTSGTLLSTAITCYNGNNVSSPSNCYNTAVTSQILRTTVFRYLPNSSGLQAETDTTFDGFGLTHEVDEYDYGLATVGPIIRKTITAYNTGMGNGIVDRPSSVTITDGGNNTKAYTSYGYDETTPTFTPICPATGCSPQHSSISGSRGLLTSVLAQVNGTTNLYRKYTYYDTGTLSTSTDVSTSSTTNGATTTYNYSYTNNADCGNAFVTSITEPLSLSRSMTWDCNGGVMLSLTDENTNVSSTAYSGTNYTNVFWRPYSTTDQAGTTTNYFYYLNASNQPFQTEAKSATFNSGNSVIDTLTTSDGFGRTIFHQTKQGPSVANYDTVATCYDTEGRVSFTSLPYSTTAITSGTGCPSGSAGTSTTYDALNRVSILSDSGGGSTTYSYNENDVTQTLTSPTQAKQQEYDALGRLTSVCEITSGTTQFPGASCKQHTTATGYLSQYAYDVLGNRTNVTQNAQAAAGQQQTRGYIYDMLGRLTSETNPETKNAAVTYTYDLLSSDPTCSPITSAGNMVKRLDAAGNATCYSGYDALHRVGSVTYPSTSTPAKHFVYDSAAVNGTVMSNAKTRLAEAYTCIGTCSSNMTDLGFSYSATGQTTDVWELTPHSGTNYYYHVTSTPWPNGAPNVLNHLVGLPTITYLTDGEGRGSTVSDSNGKNPISAITFNAASQVTALTLNSADHDTFTFDPNTGRMSQYQFNMGTAPLIDKGVLNWNPNGSLLGLTITDQINTTNSQTCSYSHDDLGRVSSANCGCSLWSQTFSYDPFGNINKAIPTGCTAMSFLVSYDYTNYTNQITTGPFSYTSTSDPNGKTGNMTVDNNHTYVWDTENKLITIDSGSSSGICIVYDALGRAVEQDKGSACSISPTSSAEIVYSPSGAKLALMNGSTLTKAFVPLPGGVTAVYNSSGLQYFRHPDWLGSSRLSTTTGRTKYYDVAYAPFGEPYAGSGTKDLSFTGQNQDTESGNVPGGAGGLYDFLYREHSPVQGRWLSPDPSGLAAVNPSDPQSWNRYAYVGNRALSLIDPLGLCGEWGWGYVECDGGMGGGGGAGDGETGGGGGSPCDPVFDPLCGSFGGGGGGGIGGGGGLPLNPPQRTGGWPGNETAGLPSGLSSSPFDFRDLLGFAPGTQCGNAISCADTWDVPSMISPLPLLDNFQSSGPSAPCTVPPADWKLRRCLAGCGLWKLGRVVWDEIGCEIKMFNPKYCQLKGYNQEGGMGSCEENCAIEWEDRHPECDPWPGEDPPPHDY
jgi:RHS repeat-associated protein